MVAQINKSYLQVRPWKVFPRLISYALFEGRPLTTKGRWINPLVFCVLKTLANIPVHREVKKPIFIVGTGRSGTTMLGTVLSLHRAVGFLNEPKAVWHTIYPFEDVFANYATTKGGRLILSGHDASRAVQQRAQRIVAGYLSLIRASRLVDKYPELIFRIPFVRAIFPDAKFIFITRNGWDTCFSIKRWSENKRQHKGKAVHDWWGKNDLKWKTMLRELVPTNKWLWQVKDEVALLTSDQDRAIVEWVLCMQEGLKYCGRLNDFYLLRYEDVTASPAGQLKKLLEFCELPPDQAVKEYVSLEVHPHLGHDRNIKLPSFLMPIFRQTMKDLGYDKD